MARRRFTVRDIAEILEHWQAGRSICSISRSLGVCRSTVRKYVYAAEARGYHQGNPTPPQGWEAFLPNSYLLQDITSGLYDNAPNRDFYLHFLSKDRNGDIKFSHWSRPAANSWDDLLAKPTMDIFVDWLHSTKNSQRDLSIFQERMGLISGRGKTLEEVGQEFEITRERVRQIVNRFLSHLSHPTRRKQLMPFSTYLKKLFQKHGGIMTLREISNDEHFTGDLGCFSPMPVIELILLCKSSYPCPAIITIPHLPGTSSTKVRLDNII